MVHWDLIIIGGGAAGIMAAISAKKTHPKIKVVLMERTFAIGRKILVSGAGRCNITNANLDSGNWRTRFVSDSPQVLDNVFEKFAYRDIINFFKELGIEVYEESKNKTGKIFPKTDSAKNVVTLLNDELYRLGVEVMVNTSVNSIRKEGNLFSVETKDENGGRKFFEANQVILCAGGKTYPILGTDGTAFELAMHLGHSILVPVPAAGPITSGDTICKAMQGTKVFCKCDLYINNKLVKSSNEELLFTLYGLSGSVIFYISRAVSINFNRDSFINNCFVLVNFVPDKTVEQLKLYFENLWANRPGQHLELSLYGIITNKLAYGLLKNINLNPTKQVKDLTELEKDTLFKALNSFKININGTKSWAEAEFTSGGVRLSEIDENTLQSKIVPGLYLCGEVLNVDGDVGGFNLSWAWSSGWVAGKLAK